MIKSERNRAQLLSVDLTKKSLEVDRLCGGGNLCRKQEEDRSRPVTTENSTVSSQWTGGF
eukprot:UN27208